MNSTNHVINRVDIVGTIENIYLPNPDEKIIKLRIKSGRNKPELILKHEISEAFLKVNFKNGDRIVAEGFLESYRSPAPYSMKNRSSIIVRNILPATEFDNDYNRFILSGELVSGNISSYGLELYVRVTADNGNLDTIKVVSYSISDEYDFLRKGQPALLTGAVQTAKKFNSNIGRFVYYQNIVTY